MRDAFEGMRRPRILIPENTPLSLLSMIGPGALDWLFTPMAEIWVTDMVWEEATRDPDDDDDQRARQRRDIREWFAKNEQRIHIQPTDAGDEYRKAMETWRRLPEKPRELKPSWKGRGERSILEILDSVEKAAADGAAVIAIVDDRKARAAIRVLERIDIDLMATQTYLEWLVRRFDVKEASTAWTAIKVAAGGKVPHAPEDDPIHIHKTRTAAEE